MNRTIIALTLILTASPVAALEREPGGAIGRDVGSHQASGERGGDGGRDGLGSGSARDFGSRSYSDRDHNGHDRG
jgi:hypothetical protein